MTSDIEYLFNLILGLRTFKGFSVLKQRCHGGPGNTLLFFSLLSSPLLSSSLLFPSLYHTSLLLSSLPFPSILVSSLHHLTYISPFFLPFSFLPFPYIPFSSHPISSPLFFLSRFSLLSSFLSFILVRLPHYFARSTLWLAVLLIAFTTRRTPASNTTVTGRSGSIYTETGQRKSLVRGHAHFLPLKIYSSFMQP